MVGVNVGENEESYASELPYFKGFISEVKITKADA